MTNSSSRREVLHALAGTGVLLSGATTGSAQERERSLILRPKWDLVNLATSVPIEEFEGVHEKSYASWVENGELVQTWLTPSKAMRDRIPAALVLFRVHEPFAIPGRTDPTAMTGTVSVGGRGWAELDISEPVSYDEFCGDRPYAVMVHQGEGRSQLLTGEGELAPGQYIVKVEPPCTIDLEGSDSENPSQASYHTLRTTHPVDDRGVEDVDVRVYRVSATKSVYGSVSPDAVELVSRATTGSDGVAVFDGVDGGAPLERGQLSQYRSDYATDSDTGIVVTCVNNPSGTVGNGTWYGVSQYSAQEFFSTDTAGSSLPLDSQLLLPPTSGNNAAGTVSIWRQVDSATSQTMHVELTRDSATTDNPNSTFKTVGNGTLSIKVPESVTVQYDETETTLSSDFRQGSNYVSDDSHRYDVASFAADTTTPALPSHSVFGSEYVAIQSGMDSDDRQAQVARDVLGVMPYTGAVADVYSFWKTYFADNSEVVRTLGNESDKNLETERNTHDTVTSKTWNDNPFGAAFSVPIEFEDDTAGEQTFGFHGFWDRGMLGGRNNFNYVFSLGPHIDI